MPDSPSSGRRSAPFAVGSLTALCCAIYLVSDLTRKTWDASILAICEDPGLARSAAGLVKDQYGLGTSGSILSVALLPVFAVASMTAARALRRRLGDEEKTALALFGAGLASAALLFATDGATLASGLPLLAVLSASMHGSNLMLIGELPGQFARYGRVGTVSGLLNAFTYVGAAISIYGFPVLHARFGGWRPVFGLWTAVMGIGIVLLLLALRRWIPFRKRRDALPSGSGLC